jgi:RNA polymerase sigma-70 factor (ECF subfamily)
MAEPSYELVRRAQQGDRAAMGALVQSQQTYVYSIALSVVKDPTEAADMTQEAFIRLLRSLHTYRGETRFTTWLYRLATNVCLDGLRRRRGPASSGGRPFISLDLEGDEDEATARDRLVDEDRWGRPEEGSALRESAAEVRRALVALNPAQRLALTLHYFDDMRYEDIAQVMGLPLNTVKSHIRRGKERLSRLLDRDGNGSTGRQPCPALT